jgi:hypothetical protein
MATMDELEKGHDAALETLLRQRAGKGGDSDWALVRSLVHRAVHLCAERKAGEFCAVATLFAEMINHAHELLHPGNRDAPSHRGVQH